MDGQSPSMAKQVGYCNLPSFRKGVIREFPASEIVVNVGIEVEFPLLR